jgi:hypothetical protein
MITFTFLTNDHLKEELIMAYILSSSEKGYMVEYVQKRSNTPKQLLSSNYPLSSKNSYSNSKASEKTKAIKEQILKFMISLKKSIQAKLIKLNGSRNKYSVSLTLDLLSAPSQKILFTT